MIEFFIIISITIIVSLYFYIIYLVVNWYEHEIETIEGATFLIVVLWPFTIWFLPIVRNNKNKEDLNKWMDSL